MKTIQQFLLRPWLYLFIVIIGIALKFYGIESKYFWYDEVETVMHASGISDRNYHLTIPVNKIKNISYYQNLLHLNSQDYTVGTQIKGLAAMPQLAPLHPALLIFWHRIAGDDIVDYRLLNFFLFLLTLPFLFLLCKFLFKTDLAGWIAISLFSISPFFTIYTQENRYIILWTFCVITLNYIFVLAIYHNKLKGWILYAFLGVLSMYTVLINAMLLLGHLMYVLIFRKDLWLQYSITLLSIVLICIPWILSMYHFKEDVLAAMKWQVFTNKIYFWEPLYLQIVGFSQLFISPLETVWSYRPSSIDGNIGTLLILVISACVILVFIIYAIIHMYKNTNRQNWYLLSFITFPTLVFIYILDVSRNGWISLIWRYQILSLVGILIFLIYILVPRFIGENYFMQPFSSY